MAQGHHHYRSGGGGGGLLLRERRVRRGILNQDPKLQGCLFSHAVLCTRQLNFEDTGFSAGRIHAARAFIILAILVIACCFLVLFARQVRIAQGGLPSLSQPRVSQLVLLSAGFAGEPPSGCVSFSPLDRRLCSRTVGARRFV